MFKYMLLKRVTFESDEYNEKRAVDLINLKDE